ncbi:MAG: DUF4294 domain-containing protein [Sediminibacterium sp.]|nr:DUF4294 domain-containing protein [Chitinophagaceae bacterium]MCA6447413.1 DUF4294 domain-containing protein [Chitinophagaceae bacterium]
MKRIQNHIIFCFFLLALAFTTKAQQVTLDTLRVSAYITPEGDTVGQSWLLPVEVLGRMNAAQRQAHAEWTRLRNAVYVTFPYAKAASRIMNEINAQLVHVKDKKQRRALIRSREKELKRDFTDKLTKLSVYQGKVLMKLINRETGNNCYEIIDEYKGFVAAAFWQTIAVVFGSNLKQSYDPATKDAEMEKIVRDVERMYGYAGRG